ncbi:hypothetical protein BVC80_1791g50 [Macleaya cordata]|uniref:DUF3741 domain-containing protein n=1 Tax=Macleaya cordata TaxID=56857 RepID=A0A200QPU1_MACCD|nr:hypothetical protein BVC80_1791g50 [Macleaya cordata]
MKDLSFFLLKNTLGSKMKKSLRNFCNDDGSTSTLNQKLKPTYHHDLSNFMPTPSLLVGSSSTSYLDNYNSTSSTTNIATNRSPTLEEMILQLELEEAAARKAKLDDYGEFRRRMSCVNNSDVLRSARNALNQYPRFSLDGRDAMYRSNFGPSLGGFESHRKSVCCSSNGVRGRISKDGFDLDFEKNISLLPSTLAGESVIWCKPGVVAKLMGLEAMPQPITTRKHGRGKLSTSLIRKENLRRAEMQEIEKRRLVMGLNGCKRIGRDTGRAEGSCSTTSYYVMKPISVKPMKTRTSWQTRLI